MTNQEIEYLKNTVIDGVLNENNVIWEKAFSETYPSLSMSVDWHYEKVLSKAISQHEALQV